MRCVIFVAGQFVDTQNAELLLYTFIPAKKWKMLYKYHKHHKHLYVHHLLEFSHPFRHDNKLCSVNCLHDIFCNAGRNDNQVNKEHQAESYSITVGLCLIYKPSFQQDKPYWHSINVGHPLPSEHLQLCMTNASFAFICKCVNVFHQQWGPD